MPQADADAKFPETSSLVGIAAAAAYCKVPDDLLLEYVRSGHAPCYFFKGCRANPLFLRGEIRAWARNNLLDKQRGFPVPKTLLIPDGPAPVNVPLKLRMIGEELLSLNVPVGGPLSGVYFLCEMDEVLYVGKSSNVVTRVGTHLANNIPFTTVFYLPCPAGEAEVTEAEFIKCLQPPYNTIGK